MLHYLTEPNVSDAEWELRRKVLDLHDQLVRARLFKGMGKEGNEEYRGWRARSQELRKEIKKLPAFKNLKSERQERIISGSELYVGGLRGALEQIDIDRAYFDAIYNYLSGQVHVASNSFYFMHHNRIDFEEPAAYQFYIAGFAIANARYFLLPAALRMATIDTNVLNSIDGAEIADMKALAEKPFGEME
jgi:hypothetical protein